MEQKIRIPFRYQLRLAVLAAEVTGSFRHVWKDTRSLTLWLDKTYARIEKIAKDRNINIPETLVDMHARQD